jgi:signal peptidase I
LESGRRGGKHRAGYSDAVTGSTEPDDSAAEQTLEPTGTAAEQPLQPTDTAAEQPLEPTETAAADAETDEPKKRGALRESAILIAIAVVLYYVMLTFVARPYLIPSESMEPTLHGCTGCTGDRIMVDKLTYRFGSPRPGDVIVFKGPPNWDIGYKSIRSKNTAVRWADRPSNAAPTPASRWTARRSTSHFSTRRR